MSPTALSRLIKCLFLGFVLLLAGGVWYYAWGRKPSLVLSAKIERRDGAPTSHLISPGEVLLLTATKATLYDTAKGQPRWSANLGVQPAAATPPPAMASPSAKFDPALAAKVRTRFAKLEEWAAKLSAKRAKLKGKKQIEAFNEEAAKYHAELKAARAEAVSVREAEFAYAAAVRGQVQPQEGDDDADFFAPWETKAEVFADGGKIWVAQGRRIVALDRANGQLTKQVPLAGEFDHAMRGVGRFYVVAAAGDGGRQVVAVNLADGAAAGFGVTTPGTSERFTFAGEGQPATPNLQPARAEFSAAGGELLQVDIHLVESKVTERQVMSGSYISDMEEADKKTTGGWAADAMVVAQSLAKEAERDATGGKERIDESTYEVTLRRPFATGLAPVGPLRVQGRPEVFSTAGFDLLAAGQTLLAFDHANKKLWESKLAGPLVFGDWADEEGAYGEAPDERTATTARPCVEDAERLYLFDKAFLSAFERSSGRPLWRLPSSGIRKVQLDGSGLLYVLSSNVAPESYGLNTNHPVMMKVEAKSGKIVWKIEKYQNVFVSGGDLYATRETQNAEDAINRAFRSAAPETRFKLYKLSTRDGEPQWEWFQVRRPLRIEVERKKVSLLFPDELQLLKSIAL